jgi:hypothetical protein
MVAPFADAPIVDVAAEITGRDGIDDIRLLGGKSDDAEMRTDRNADVLEDAVVFLDRAVVDRDARVVDGLVHHPERVGLRRPLKIVDSLRPVALTSGVDLIDSNDFTRLGLSEQFLVVEAPPRRSIAAE